MIHMMVFRLVIVIHAICLSELGLGNPLKTRRLVLKNNLHFWSPQAARSDLLMTFVGGEDAYSNAGVSQTHLKQSSDMAPNLGKFSKHRAGSARNTVDVGQLSVSAGHKHREFARIADSFVLLNFLSESKTNQEHRIKRDINAGEANSHEAVDKYTIDEQIAKRSGNAVEENHSPVISQSRLSETPGSNSPESSDTGGDNPSFRPDEVRHVPEQSARRQLTPGENNNLGDTPGGNMGGNTRNELVAAETNLLSGIATNIQSLRPNVVHPNEETSGSSQLHLDGNTNLGNTHGGSNNDSISNEVDAVETGVRPVEIINTNNGVIGDLPHSVDIGSKDNRDTGIQETNGTNEDYNREQLNHAVDNIDRNNLIPAVSNESIAERVLNSENSSYSALNNVTNGSPHAVMPATLDANQNINQIPNLSNENIISSNNITEANKPHEDVGSVSEIHPTRTVQEITSAGSSPEILSSAKSLQINFFDSEASTVTESTRTRNVVDAVNAAFTSISASTSDITGTINIQTIESKSSSVFSLGTEAMSRPMRIQPSATMTIHTSSTLDQTNLMMISSHETKLDHDGDVESDNLPEHSEAILATSSLIYHSSSPSSSTAAFTTTIRSPPTRTVGIVVITHPSVNISVESHSKPDSPQRVTIAAETSSLNLPGAHASDLETKPLSVASTYPPEHPHVIPENTTSTNHQVNVTSSAIDVPQDATFNTKEESTLSGEPHPTTVQVPHQAEPPSTYMEFKFSMSWPDFCQQERSIRQELVDLVQGRSTQGHIAVDQIRLIGSQSENCYRGDSSEMAEILVKMYVMDKTGNFDRELTRLYADIIKSNLPFEERRNSTISGTLRAIQLHDQGDAEGGTSSGPSSEESEDSSIDPRVTIAIVLAVVGGCCCVGLIILQVIVRRRQKETPVLPPITSSDSQSSSDSIQLASVLKDRPNSGLFNPALDILDPPDPSHPMNHVQLSNFCMDENKIAEEFQKLPLRMPRPSMVPVGEEDKNRYANILPLVHTRVKLVHEGMERRSSYINANYITGPNSQCQYYIATQGPTEKTTSDFWAMVWQEKCKAIVMLTQMEEQGQSKCASYWPELVGKSAAHRHGDFLIELKHKDVHQEYIISTLEVNNLRKIETRTIDHFWYTCWPPNGMPEPISLVKLVLDVRPKYENGITPLVVHCSPGTGRTCTFIALDLCMRQFETKRTVDIMKIVYSIRQERAGAIQNKEQYILLYNAVHEYATIVMTPGVSAASSVATLQALLSS